MKARSTDLLTHDVKLSVGTVTKYRMTVPNGDTMFALVDETTGLLVIHEYDGTWGHWWNPDHIGNQTFVEFLRTQSCEYLANKLVPSNRQRCIDVEETTKAHQALARRHGCDKEVLEEIERADWDEVASGVSRNPLVEAGVLDEYWSLIKDEDSQHMIMVRDICLPLLKRALKVASEGVA